MATPETTTWEIKPHTRAKHAILKVYLQGWSPILNRAFGKIVYIDAFAGPGSYEGGDEGSPIIALRSVIDRKEPLTSNVIFIFVEKEADRAAALEKKIHEFQAIPQNVVVEPVKIAEFSTAYQELSLKLKGRDGHLPPTFAFIDPFGHSGAPFSIIQDIMRSPRCEVLINFPYDSINRFKTVEEKSASFTELFGTDEWKEGANIEDRQERNRFFHDLYKNQLKRAAGIRYIRSFEMRDDHGLVDYYLFFGTNSEKGIDQMKYAMWKQDPVGGIRFSDATDPNQTVLFGSEPNLEELREHIQSEFPDKTIAVQELFYFVRGETAYRIQVHCREVLKQMEQAQILTVINPPPRRKRGQFPDDATFSVHIKRL